MEKIQIIARAHYEAGPESNKVLAHKLFNAMDANGDGRVNIDEFKKFMEINGRGCGRGWFDFLDRDNSGALDFWEVLTFYYLMTSGRPFCKSCKELVTAEYFSCVQCYDSPEGSYCLCLPCYRSLNWAHHHNGRSLFLDNYSLLEAMRIGRRDMNQPPPRPPPRSSSSNVNVLAHPSNNNSSRAALKTLEAALKVADFGVNLGSNLGFCSIM